MLQAKALTKRLGGRAVLSGIDLSCEGAQVVLVVGRNGAGKSTLLRVIAGLLEPDSGTVVLNGKPIFGASAEARRHVGYLPDATDIFPELSVCELIALVEALKLVRSSDDQRSAWRARMGLRLGLDDLWDQRLRTLSLGQRKRAYLMAALVGDPWLLVMDEPTNGLDEGGCDLIREIISERQAAGMGVVVASNDLTFARALHGPTLRRIEGGLLHATDAASWNGTGGGG
jgi:ABC-type multidrug transport system ATPase subunit